MSIRLANAPVSWGIYEFEGAGQKYTYQRVLDEIAETGYEALELGPWGFLPTDPDVLRAELEKRNLRLLSSFVPVNFADASSLAHGEEHALKVGRLLKALDAVAIVLADDNGTVPELIQRAGQRSGSYLSSSQWDTYAAGVNQVARRIYDELGLKVVFHHHCAGYVETPEETRHLMDRTDPDLVGLCLDTGHWEYAGGDSLEAVREYGERVRYLHLKDCDPNIRTLARQERMDYFAATAAGVFCELGEGSVDFPGIIREMKGYGYDGWAIVEQDVLTDDLEAPRQSARRNREYLRSIGL
jgi:inosose dehydratase